MYKPDRHVSALIIDMLCRISQYHPRNFLLKFRRRFVIHGHRFWKKNVTLWASQCYKASANKISFTINQHNADYVQCIPLGNNLFRREVLLSARWAGQQFSSPGPTSPTPAFVATGKGEIKKKKMHSFLPSYIT